MKLMDEEVVPPTDHLNNVELIAKDKSFWTSERICIDRAKQKLDIWYLIKKKKKSIA